MGVELKWNRVDDYVKVYLPIIALVAASSVLITALVTEPVRRSTGYAPEQPISYSHQLHAGQMRVDCGYCHTAAAVSRHASVPATAVCMNCHSVAAIDKPGVARLRDTFKAGRPVVWRRVHRLPDFVYFSHGMHIQAEIGCENCHGDVRRMDVLAQVSSLSMGSCLSCHRNANTRVVGSRANLRGPENCSACHR